MKEAGSRYVRLYLSLARYCFVRELSFRGNFLVRCAGQSLWLVLILTFFQLIFLNTRRIGDWSHNDYLFFMGTSFLVNGTVSGLFLVNCTNLSELIRTGDLDFALTKPIDEQFLLSTQRVDWSNLPNLFVGGALVLYAWQRSGNWPTILQGINYVLLLIAGVAVLYSLMLMMASSSVWIVRNRSLHEMWFYVTQFARYPADIYLSHGGGRVLYFVLMYLLPVLLAITTPARYGVKMVEWPMVLYLFLAAGVSLAVSRWFFRFALSAYRSASS
ncbi:hypothetical protein Pan216_05570 [Planctomycetes bacterium Pan216]|uniref:ABC-2 family transporter protein n=1 Tax=Kolteria novifilia TaxID=2527975 RepID=A0A518AYB9_9BACT|nr:hypothetical protein Pan216_05570 [Planctomycetes bacterium Pan216]